MPRLEGKIAIVTGGSSGIGKAICLEYGKEGATVVVAARREEKSKEVVEEIKKNGGDAVFKKTDVFKEEDIKDLVKFTIVKYGKLDILVNNAGVQRMAPLEDVTVENWNYVISGNLTAVFIAVREAMPHLLKTKGNIVTTASMAAIKPVDMHYAYSASKAGVAMFMKDIAKDYAATGVTANNICPGLVDTPLLADATPEAVKALEAEIPMKHMGTPWDIAQMAVFLGSNESKWMTGQNLCVDGGATLL